MRSEGPPLPLAFLRCGSCRFTAIYFISFYVALEDAGLGGWRWLLFGAAYWLLFTLATEFLNRLADQVEDRINQPERTALCSVVGYRRLKDICVVLWLGVAAVNLGWLVVQPEPALAIFLILGMFSSLNYSYGLRLKLNRWLSQFVLTFPFLGTFLTGWAVSVRVEQLRPALDDLATRTLPFLAVVMLFMAGFAGIKDITDVAGDERVGYRSLWISLIRENATFVTATLCVLPFATVILFTALDLLPGRFLALLPALPLSGLVAFWANRARSTAERAAAREIYYHYWYFFVSASLVLFVPRPATLGAVLGAAAYWLLASQYLHWSGGIRRPTLEALRGMLVGIHAVI